MVRILKDFFREEDGLGTVEIVLLIAVLVGLALMFRKSIVGFVSSVLGKTLDTKGEFDSGNIGDTKPQAQP